MIRLKNFTRNSKIDRSAEEIAVIVHHFKLLDLWNVGIYCDLSGTIGCANVRVDHSSVLYFGV